MPEGILLTLEDANGDPVANSPGVSGQCFPRDNVGTPALAWTLPTDANGLLTVPTEAAFSVGDEVWVGIGEGSLLDPASWRAHFALHRVQEY